MIKVKLSPEETVAINNALNELLHGPDAIDVSEFQTRVGVSRNEALQLLDKVGRLLSAHA
jgi:hypothetical protein